MKKTIVYLITAFCMTIILLIPASALAAETGQPSDSFLMQNMISLFSNGKLILPDEMKSAEITADENAGGLLLKGTQAQLCSGKIRLANTFDFSGGTVGRITVDGLQERGLKASVEVYLDNQEEPVAVVPLKNCSGKKDWLHAGARTVNVLELGLTGKHSVSIRIADASKQKKDSKITVLLRSVEFAQNSLPVLWFNIDESQGSVDAMNDDPEHDTECYGSVYLQVPDGYQSEYGGKTTSQTLDLEYIRGRGNSTWSGDKKPYKVKLDKGNDLFGMGKNKHWVLLANRFDNSMIRNKMTYWLGDRLGMEFTPQSVPVEVVMNDEYYGSYFLTEHIRVGESRVDIDDLEEDGGKDATTEPTITGGYLLSMDSGSYEDEDPLSFFTTQGVGLYLEHPSFEGYKNDAQLNYIKAYVQATENAICGPNFRDSAGKSYADYMDISSAVDYYWMQELSMNGDAYNSGSTYLYKKRNGKLYWGPLWDFDYVAWGDLQYDSYSTDGFVTSATWFSHLLMDPAFMKSLKDRWPVIRWYMNEVTRAGGLLDQYRDQLAVSKAYDLEKWGTYDENTYYYSSEDTIASAADIKRTYRDEVEQLRGWITQRVGWVDKNLSQLRPDSVTIRFKAGKKVIKKITVASGSVIKTLPKAPAKKGYVFTGWYQGSEKITGDWYPYTDCTVTAHYAKRSIKAKKLYLGSYYAAVALNGPDYCPDYTVLPSKAWNKDNIRWSSSNKKIATVTKDGTVVPKKTGTVTITASIKKGPKAKYKLKVVKKYSSIKRQSTFKLAKKKIKLKRKASTQIRIKATPKYHREQDIYWYTSNKKIATVNGNGVVTAKKKKGTATIYAINTDRGIVRQCKVIVR